MEKRLKKMKKTVDEQKFYVIIIDVYELRAIHNNPISHVA